MPRAVVPISTEHAYFITVRCNNREWFKLPMPVVWAIMGMYLYFLRHAYNIRIHAFVLMNNHFHLIVSAPDGNLSEAMNYFMRETSRQIGFDTMRINKIYGGRFHRSLLNGPFSYLNAYKYLYLNPLKARITDDVLEYPYSTLRGLLGLDPMIIPVEYDETLFSSVEDTLKWLNQMPTNENYDFIRKALRRKEFALPNVKGNKLNPLNFKRL